MLSEARSRAGGALAKAAPYTVKVEHGGATLYPRPVLGLRRAGQRAGRLQRPEAQRLQLLRHPQLSLALTPIVRRDRIAVRRVPAQRRRAPVRSPDAPPLDIPCLATRVEYQRCRFVKPVPGRVDAGRLLGRSALVGVQPLHQRPVSRADLLQGRPALKPQDLIGLLLRHRPWVTPRGAAAGRRSRSASTRQPGAGGRDTPLGAGRARSRIAVRTGRAGPGSGSDRQGLSGIGARQGDPLPGPPRSGRSRP